jgi:hypothetical protein
MEGATIRDGLIRARLEGKDTIEDKMLINRNGPLRPNLRSNISKECFGFGLGVGVLTWG